MSTMDASLSFPFPELPPVFLPVLGIPGACHVFQKGPILVIGKPSAEACNAAAGWSFFLPVTPAPFKMAKELT